MKQLYKQLESLVHDSRLLNNLLTDNCAFPFTKEGRVLSYLIDNQVISYKEYEQISKDYSDRNKYLGLFDMAPRTFGETWGEQHILSLFPKFKKATKELLN